MLLFILGLLPFAELSNTVDIVEDSNGFDSENSLGSADNFDSYCSSDKSNFDYSLVLQYNSDNIMSSQHFTVC